ncbi:MAG: hypothetical protein L0J08_09065 [Micrococcaceae bacterium]|nr:hypothetical protein [Micrococcaceae bacterium]
MSITTETKKQNDGAAKHSTESLDAMLDAPQAPKRSRLSRIPLLRKLALDKDPEGQFPVETGVGFGEWVPFESKGTILRTNMRSAKSGLYAPSVPGAPSTTRQAEILNTAKIAAPTGVDGVSAGRDVLSQTPVSKDPVTDYNATPRRVTSTNALLIGDVGAGKSTYGKCGYVLRPG